MPPSEPAVAAAAAAVPRAGDNAIWQSIEEEESLNEFLDHIVDADDVVAGENGPSDAMRVWDELERPSSNPHDALSAPALVNGDQPTKQGGSTGEADVASRQKRQSDRDSAAGRDGGEGPGSAGGSAGGSANGALGGGATKIALDGERALLNGAPKGSLSGGSGNSEGGSGGSGSFDEISEPTREAHQYLGEYPDAIRVLRQLRVAAGHAVGPDPEPMLKRFDAADVTKRLSALLDSVSNDQKAGSLVQMFILRLGGRENGVALQTSKSFVRVNSVHGEKFWKYHDVSCAFSFNVAPSTIKQAMLGLPGRAFLLQRPEWTPSVCCYRPMEYPRLACAIECQVHSTMAVPVFLEDPSPPAASGSCTPVTVIEVLLDHQNTDLGEVHDFIARCVAKHGFYTVGREQLGPAKSMRDLVAPQLARLCDSNASALMNLCHTLGFPLAQCWIPTAGGALVTSGAPHFSDGMTLPYRRLSSQVALAPAQAGPVGRAFEKGTMIWVDDVQQGSQVEWPLQHTTALLGLHGACACKLLLTPKDDGPKVEAVLEVFLPPNLATAEQQQQSVDALWNFLQSATQIRMHEPINAGHEDQGGDPTPTDARGANGAAAAAAAAAAAEAPPRTFSGPPMGEPGDPRPPWGVTLEILQQHFSKHLKEAAKDLGVGSTTLKRICRHFGIARWPRRTLVSKQGKLHNALKTLSAEGSLGFHDGSMLSGGGSGSMMSLGATGTEGTVDVGDAFAAGGSVHGPLRAFSGGFGSGAPGAGGAHQGGPGVAAPGPHMGIPVAGAVVPNGLPIAHQHGAALHAAALAGPPGPLGSDKSTATILRGHSVHGASAFNLRGGGGSPAPTANEVRLGGPAGRGGSAYGGAYFENLGGARHGAQGSGAGGSVHGQSNLAGFKRGAADELGPWGPGSGSPGGDPAFGHMGGDGKRGSTWHGGDAAWHAMEGRNVGGPKGMHFQAFQAAGMHAGAGAGSRGGSPALDGGVGVSANGHTSSGNGGRDSRSGGAGSDAATDADMLRSFLADESPSGSPALGPTEHVLGAAQRQSFTFKISFGEDTIRLKLTSDMSYADLVSRIRGSVDVDPARLRLRYKDDDEEWCTLAGDEDLDECRAVSTPKGVMRVQASVEGFGSEAKFPAAPGVATA